MKSNNGLLVGASVLCLALFAGAFIWFSGEKAKSYGRKSTPDQIDLWIGPGKTELPPDGKPAASSREMRSGLGDGIFSNFDYGYRLPKHPRVRFVHGKYTFVTPEVEAIDSIRADDRRVGLKGLKLILHPPLYGSTHEQARTFTYDLLRQIQDAG